MGGQFAGLRVLVPGEAGLVVEVDTDGVGMSPVDEGPADDPASAAAGDVGVGPVALHAQVHLVAAAHDAVGHVVHAGAQQVGVLVAAAGDVEEVVAQAVLALDELLGGLVGPAPVEEPEAALADVAEDLDIGLRGRPVHGGRGGVLARPQQPAVDMQVLHGPRLLDADRHGRGREGGGHLTAINACESELKVGGRQFRGGGAHHGQVDPLVGLESGPALRQEDLDLGGRGG